ncbi:hypothetical protein ICM05_08600 [Leucobacter sp. cx-42]|uniref:hypothetical protein n=1 Tax=unclassified Leucobacter TaxID=2621730 RepID=UPI00165D56CF|nr:MULTISPECIES: hypothetical protein [unclassified Leucobacter]MBC9954704.1 hypothetical protein [Leucobacter sp. cx-42]
MRLIRTAWWLTVEFIANRYLFIEMAPWVLPLIGGPMVSTHVGETFDPFWFWLGVALIAIGTFPLAIRQYFLRHVQKKQDEQDARERASLRLVSRMVPLLSAMETAGLRDRQRLRDQAFEEIVAQLVKTAYPGELGYRVTLFELGRDGRGNVHMRPVASAGRKDQPRAHDDGDEVFVGMMSLLTGESDSVSKQKMIGNEYTSFAAVSVSRGDQVFGILTVDTASETDLFEVDEANLIPIADVLAEYYAAAKRKPHTRRGALFRLGMYSVGNALNQRGSGT